MSGLIINVAGNYPHARQKGGPSYLSAVKANQSKSTVPLKPSEARSTKYTRCVPVIRETFAFTVFSLSHAGTSIMPANLPSQSSRRSSIFAPPVPFPETFILTVFAGNRPKSTFAKPKYEPLPAHNAISASRSSSRPEYAPRK